MAEIRRKFDEDFKHGAVRLVRETGKPIAQVARELGINEGTLGTGAPRIAAPGRGQGGVERGRAGEWSGCGRRTPSCRCSVMCSSARWPSGSERRRAAGDGGRVHRRPEGAVPGPYATSCRALGVSPAWLYKWRDGDASPRRARRDQLTVAIGQLFAAHQGKYGSPRMTAELREAGWRVSEKTVAVIMRELGLGPGEETPQGRPDRYNFAAQ